VVLATAIVELAELTAIDSRAEVMVNDIVPLTVPEVAVIVVLPPATPVARPAALIVAMAGAEEVQLTELVRFCALPSLNVPVAVRCMVPATAIVELAEVIAIDFSVGVDLPDVDVEEPPPHPEASVVAATMTTSVKTHRVRAWNLFSDTFPPGF
jgi:hypothetical protein